jgi:hypothetical protein
MNKLRIIAMATCVTWSMITGAQAFTEKTSDEIFNEADAMWLIPLTQGALDIVCRVI